jgi:hypothetical protein
MVTIARQVEKYSRLGKKQMDFKMGEIYSEKRMHAECERNVRVRERKGNSAPTNVLCTEKADG